MQKADISVIIPTRNRAAWLPKCLAHLEQQTFPAGRFEVLVIDDGSTDDTESVLARYASGAPVCIRVLSQGACGLAEARNLGAREAVGDALLFLSDDELVSPRLLEQHVQARSRQRDDVCTMGDIHRHPQLPRDTFTRLFLERPPIRTNTDEPTNFLDWSRSNFCVGRQAFLDAGAFNTDAALNSVEVIELAFRLAARGVLPVHIRDARAYVWQPTTFAAERCRQYRLGYGLYHLRQHTGTAAIVERFRVKKTRIEQFVSSMTIPYYLRACNRHEEEARMLIGSLYKRVLYHERCTGYEDGCHNRPPCPPSVDEPAYASEAFEKA